MGIFCFVSDVRSLLSVALEGDVDLHLASSALMEKGIEVTVSQGNGETLFSVEKESELPTLLSFLRDHGVPFCSTKVHGPCEFFAQLREEGIVSGPFIQISEDYRTGRLKFSVR